MAFIECNLSRIEKRVRDNGSKYIVCTWVGGTGDTKAPVVVDGKLNLAAAKARQVTLVKCLFPANEEMFQAYWNKDTGLKSLVRAAVDEATGEVKEKAQCSDLSQTTKVGLCYERVPLDELSKEIRVISFKGSDGNIHRQNYINVVGWADGDGKWSEDITAKEMATNNLNRGLLNGTYWVEDDDNNQSSTDTTPKATTNVDDDL